MLSQIFYLKTGRVALVQKLVSRTFHSELIGSCISTYTTMSRDPDESHRDMIGYTVWNILQDTAQFIFYNCT